MNHDRKKGSLATFGSLPQPRFSFDPSAAAVEAAISDGSLPLVPRLLRFLAGGWPASAATSGAAAGCSRDSSAADATKLFLGMPMDVKRAMVTSCSVCGVDDTE